MPTQARRLASRVLHAPARRALTGLCLWLMAGTASAETVIAAHYAGPTERYAHGVLGDTTEHGTLVLKFSDGTQRRFTLPDNAVFEDTAPRLADVTGDGNPEVIVVESSQSQGARLVLYHANGVLAATPYIGTRYRWLAPLGASDLDQDGQIELAYIDRPHLAKTLRIWRLKEGALVEAGSLGGFTNHRIGERDIAGGIRNCGAGPEMILATGDWRQLVAVTFDAGDFAVRSLSQDTSRPSFARALSCQMHE